MRQINNHDTTKKVAWGGKKEKSNCSNCYIFMFLSEKLVSRHSILGHWIIGRNNQMMEIVSLYSRFPTNAIDNINTRTHEHARRAG